MKLRYAQKNFRFLEMDFGVKGLRLFSAMYFLAEILSCASGVACSSVRGEWPLETVQSVGAWQERWRFKVQRAPAGNAQEFERREVPKSGYSARDAALAAVLEIADIECDPKT